MENSNLTFVAIQAALSAGELLRRAFGTTFKISSKPGAHNLVTEHDEAAEATIIACVLKHFPEHAFLAEESGASSKKDAPVTWIIDPLDGTVNFAHNVPCFSVSIAAAIDGQVVSGVVYDPLVNELFVAEAGKGAFLNGNKLQVSIKSSLARSFLATGFPYNVDENPMHCIDRFSELTKEGIPIRRLGSAALDLAYVAAGRFDGYWEVSLQPWDFAAGMLLVEESGGKVSLYDGTKRDIYSTGPVLATNGLIHKELSSRLI